MNLRQFRAMASLVFKKPLVLLMTALPVTILVLRAVLSSQGMHEQLNGLDVLLRLGSSAYFLYLIVSLSYFEYNAKTAQSSFPRYAVMLPVTTAFLVGFHLLLVGVFIYLYFTFWFSFVVPLPLSGDELSIVGGGVFIFFVWVNVAMWAMGQARITAMALLLIILIVLAVAAVPLLSTPPAGFPISPMGGKLVYLGLFFIGLFAAQAAVERTRSGERGGIFKLWKNYRFSLFPLSPNARPIQAQVWFERQVLGSVMPGQGLLLAAALIGAQFIPSFGFANLGASLLVLACFMIIVPVFGFNMAKEHFNSTAEKMSSFFATRPLSDADIAKAKLTMLGHSVMLTAAIVYGAFYPAWKLGGSTLLVMGLFLKFVALEGPFVTFGLVSLLVIVPTAYCWTVAANLMALGLMGGSGVGQHFKIYREVGLSALVLVAISVSQAQNLPQTLGLIGWGLLVLLSVAWGYIILRLSQKQTVAQLLGYLKAPAKVTSAVLAYALLIIWQLHIDFNTKLLISGLIGLLSLYAILPFVAAPVAVAVNRHR